MISCRRISLIVAFFCLAIWADEVFGQLVSIVKKTESEYCIEVSTPLDARYTLQSSANLSLWVDVKEDIIGQNSYLFENTKTSRLFFRMTPWNKPADPITIVLIGDSTVADFISNLSWFNGWGQGIYDYFKPNVRVVNLAYPCYSTRVFLSSAEKTKMVTIKPNFVFVQFGLIDVIGCGGDMSERYLTSLKEYENNLNIIVQIILGFNGIPILITPLELRDFDGDGKVIRRMQDHSAIVKKVATEFKIVFIDLNQMTIDLYNKLGNKGCTYLSMYPGDIGHFSKEGAQVVAGLVVNALPSNFGPYLTGIFDHLPKP